MTVRNPLQRAAREVRAIYARLEPRKTRMNYDRLAEVYANNSRMLRALDDIRTCLHSDPNFIRMEPHDWRDEEMVPIRKEIEEPENERYWLP